MTRLLLKAYGVFAVLGVAGCLALSATPAMAEEKSEESGAALEYYQVPPVVVPVVTEKGVTQQVALAISLEVPPGKKDKISSYGPRLVDAYLSDLFGALGSGQIMMRGNMVDITAIKTRLTSVTERVLGEDKENMKGLLLQAVQQHRI